MKVIAVIDDDIYIGDMLEEILSKEGYHVLRAYSGTEALLLFREHTPDLILLDLMLPGLSGEALLPEIKKYPVIVISAKAGTADKVKLLLNPATHETQVNGMPVHLTKTEFAILKILLQNPSRVFTKSVILDSISTETPDCVESSLKVHISNLRRKLKEKSGKDYIEAVWGIGFKMIS